MHFFIETALSLQRRGMPCLYENWRHRMPPLHSYAILNAAFKNWPV